MLITTSALLTSCGGSFSSSLPTMGQVDIQMLSNDAELKKVYAEIEKVTGDHIKKMHEVQLSVSSPSIEKGREGKPEEFTLSVFYLNPKDKNKLYRVGYHSEYKWNESVYSVTLNRDADVESFVLEDEMFDMSYFSVEKLAQIVHDALAKYKDEKKYSIQYVKDIQIEDDEVEVTVYGKLATNDIEQKYYYKADFDGNQIK
jgi:hypothetical protein